VEVSALDAGRALVWAAEEIDPPAAQEIMAGRAIVASRARPGRSDPIEDALALVEIGPEASVLVLADGAGGMPAGGEAAKLAIEEMVSALHDATRSRRSIREAILTGFERANEAVIGLGVGAATTLVALHVEGALARAYHAGDSEALICGQRGRLKLRTVSHSPVGYAVEAGLLEAEDALHHDDLHLVSNLVGSSSMRIELSAPIELAPKDTILVASDGLLDNLHLFERIELMRRGPLEGAAAGLVDLASARMATPREGSPSKPDDLALILLRAAPGSHWSRGG